MREVAAHLQAPGDRRYVLREKRKLLIPKMKARDFNTCRHASSVFE
jgi:hypothetical protein